jgi:hypothetical protein
MSCRAIRVFSVGRAVRPADASHPAPLRSSLHIHVQSFGRFDEITDLVENAAPSPFRISN